MVGDEMTLYKRFKQHIKEKHYWSAQEPVVVAVSGGVDSIVLLDLLDRLPENMKPAIVIAYVNHQLREVSDEEERFVRKLASHYGYPLYTKHWEKEKHPVSGIENAARLVRYHFFSEVADKLKSRIVLTAHHRDDQVETIMMRLVRGQTLEELSGIAEQRQMGEKEIIRPLLSYGKKALIKYAVSRQLEWREDESNRSMDFTRNRFRNNLIPLLKEENKAFDRHMLNFSEELADLLTLVGPLVEKELQRTVALDVDAMVINVPEFLALGKPMQKRVLNEAFNKWVQRDGIYLIKQVHIALLIDWLEEGNPNSSLDLPNNLVARRSYARCTIEGRGYEKEEQEPGDFKLTNLNEWVDLNEGERIGLFTSIEESHVDERRVNRMYVDREELLLPLIVRHRQPGDRMRVKGLDGRKKVKDIFIDQKVPVNYRDTAWVIEDESRQIIWLVGYKESPLSLEHITDTISYVLIYQKI